MLKMVQGRFGRREVRFLGFLLVMMLAAFVLVVPVTAVGTNPAETDLNVTLEPAMSLKVLASASDTTEASDLKFELDPTGEFVTKNLVARVSTNAAEGYKLNLEMAGETTDLVQTGATRQIVGTTTDGVTGANMRNNMWGYSLLTSNTSLTTRYGNNASNFYKVPANGSAVDVLQGTGARTTTSENASAYEDNTLVFGVKVDGAISAGKYSNTIVITAVANE